LTPQQEDPLDEALRRVSRTLGHPLRMKIMNAVEAEGVASPNELATKLGESLSDVSYHTRALRDLGALEEVKTEQRRGAAEHFYRATERALLPNPEWKKIPRSARREITLSVLDLMIDEITASIEADTFNELEDRHLTRTHLLVDEQGWKETAEVLLSAFERMVKIREKAWERLSKSGEEGISSTVNIMHFKTSAIIPPPGSEDDSQPSE
jgi:DNA-binding transcriptional ArsR family regulator